MELCLPEQRSCINKKRINLDCPDACNGLFADVQIRKYVDEPSSDFKSILDEYIRYKENYVENIEFNSSFYETSFGESN